MVDKIETILRRMKQTECKTETLNCCKDLLALMGENCGMQFTTGTYL